MNRPKHSRTAISLLIGTCLAMAGCQADQARAPAAGERDIAGAEAAFRTALADLDTAPDRAEASLRTALGRDLFHGPAHNNLGVLLIRQGRLYDAAEEFEWARKLMPGNPEPRANLALVLDLGGKSTDAMDAAKSALDVRPGYLPAIQLLALIQVRDGVADDQTMDLLHSIATRSTDPQWTTWAEQQRVRLRPATAHGATATP